MKNNGVVHAFLMDTKHLISSWSQGNCKDDINKLIKDSMYILKWQNFKMFCEAILIEDL